MVGLQRGPKPCSASRSAVAVVGGGIEFDQRFVGGLGLHPTLAQTLQRAVGFRQGGLVGPRPLPARRGANARTASEARATTRPRRDRDRVSAPETWCFSARSRKVDNVRAVIAASRSASRRRSPARPRGRDLPGRRPAPRWRALRDRRSGRWWRRAGGPPAVPAIASASVRLAAFHGRGRVAHLLVEDQKCRAVFQFFSRAATLPRKSVKTVLNIGNSLCYERCS